MASVTAVEHQVEVLIHRLDPDLPLPAYAHPGDAGADLVSAVDIDLAPGEWALVPTGIALALPAGYAAFVHPRSGLAARFGLGIVNAPGTVDAGYRGEIKVLLINHDRERPIRLRRGHRIAQLVVQRVEHVQFHEVQLLPGSDRGQGGYGSTGGFHGAAPGASPNSDEPVDDAPVAGDVRARPDGATSEEADMSRFRRRKADANRDVPDGDAERDETHDESAGVSDADTVETGRAADFRGAPPTRAGGPWDISEMPDPAAGGRVDLGGMWIPVFDGLEIRVEADPESGSVISVTLVLGDSALQVQPFAAPRSGGIWSEVRSEMAAGLTSQGGTADVVEGPLGPELRAKVPVRRPDGSSGVEAARFIGVDSPRWFLRGALTGRAATEPGVDEALLQVFQEVVVVRGSEPMAPREPIPLVLPDQVQQGAAGQEEETLSPFERGPEITEVR